MIVNKFASICENCEETVPVGDGFISLIGDDWICRCFRCTMIPEIPPLKRTGKCVVCMQNKRAELIDVAGVCVDCLP